MGDPVGDGLVASLARRSAHGHGFCLPGGDPGSLQPKVLAFRVPNSLATDFCIEAAIFNDSTQQVDEINVDTFKGVVQLSAFVRSQADIDKAVQVARGVADVKSVKNDMRIQ